MKITRKVIAMIVVLGLLQLNILVAANTSTIDYSNLLDNSSSNSSSLNVADSNISVSSVSTGEIEKKPLPEQESSQSIVDRKKEPRDIVSEVTDKWETNVRRYKNGDGSYVAASYMEPVNYLKDGQWTEIDNTLISETDKELGDVYQNTSNSFKATFPKTSSQTNPVIMEKDEYSISWFLDLTKNSGILDSEAEISNYIAQETGLTDNEKLMDAGKTRSSILYKSVFSYIDLRYTVTPEKIKEDIVLNKPSLVKSFVFNLKAPGLKTKINDDNTISFFNPDKPDVTVFYIPAPFMMDSSEEQTVSYDVAMELAETDNGYELTITPDSTWINAPERVFPIFLDPTVSSSQVQTDIVDTYVHEGDAAGDHRMSTTLVVGDKTSTSELNCRSLIMTKIPALPGVIVSDARLNLSVTSGTSTWHNIDVYRINSSWSSSTMSWAVQNSISKTLIKSNVTASSYSNSPSALRYSCDVTGTIQDIYEGTLTNYGFMVKYTNEVTNPPDYNRFYSSDYTTSTVRPTLVVTYTYTPNTEIVNNGIYYIKNKNSGKYMNAEGTGDGTDVRQRVYTATTNKQWKSIYQGDGTYKLQAMNTSNKYLEVAINSNENGININIFGANYTEQYWHIMKNPYDSSFRLLSKCSDYTKGAIVEGASNTDGANIYQYTYSSGGNDEDDWYFEYCGNWAQSLTNNNPNINSVFDREDARSYMDTWHDGYNTVEYRTWPGSDCANYTSQCLHAGGLGFVGAPTSNSEAEAFENDATHWYYCPQFDHWYFFDHILGVSWTWTAVNNFRWFWGKKTDGTIANCYQYIVYDAPGDCLSDIAYLANTLLPGDILQYIGPQNHNMIVYNTVTTPGSEDILYSAHTNPQLNASFKTNVLQSSTYSGCQIVIIRIKQN